MRFGLAVLVLAVAVVMSSASSSPAATWGPPETLSSPGEWVTAEAIARGGDGTVVIAWSRRLDPYHSQLIARTRAPGGAWGEPQTLSVAEDGQNLEPSAAVDARGNALVVWRAQQASNPGTQGIRAAYAAAGERFGPSVKIAVDPNGYGVAHPYVAFDRAGGAIAIWHERDDRVHYAVRPAGGSFGPDEALPAGGSTMVTHPSFAAGANGDAVVSWVDRGRIYASVRPAGGRFGPVTGFGLDGSGGVQAAVGPEGTAVAAWYHWDASGRTTGLHAAVRPPGSDHFGSAEFVAPATGAVPAVDATGQITLVGSGGVAEPFRSLGMWAITGRAGAWGAAEPLGTAELHGTDWRPAVAYDGQGTLHVVWQHYDSVVADDTRAVLFAESRAAGGTFSGAPLTLARHDDIVPTPLLATSTLPGAIAAWQVGGSGVGYVVVADSFGDTPSTPSSPGSSRGSAASLERGGAPRSSSAHPPSGKRTATGRCKVPALRGLTKRAARRALRRQRCALGSVRRVRAARERKARVMRQRPAPGAKRPLGARVRIVLR